MCKPIRMGGGLIQYRKADIMAYLEYIIDHPQYNDNYKQKKDS